MFQDQLAPRCLAQALACSHSIRVSIDCEYFSTRFAAHGERLLVLNGMLTDVSVDQFHRRMERLAQEFEELANEDLGQPVDRRNRQTVVLAVRPWGFGVFSEYIRANHK